MTDFIKLPYFQKDQTTNAIAELTVSVDKALVTMILELPTEIDGNKSIVKFSNGEQVASSLEYETIEAMVG
jgi:hypothetical protein